MAVSKDRTKVIVRSFDRENDELESFISVNGRTYQIRLGEEVELKKEVLDVLKDAKMTTYINEFDDKGIPTKKVKERVIPRYLIETL